MPNRTLTGLSQNSSVSVSIVGDQGGPVPVEHSPHLREDRRPVYRHPVGGDPVGRGRH
jgi:hypothetical protein